MTFKLLWGTGWEQNSISIIPVTDRDGDASISTTAKKTGSCSCRLWGNFNPCDVYHELATPRADTDVALWLRDGDGSGTSWGDIWRIRARLNNSNYLELRFDTTNKMLDAYVNDSKVADGSIYMASGGWIHVQIRFKCALSGYIHTKINGVVDIEYNGDTRASATTITHIGLGYVPGSGNYLYLDDCVIGYDGWPGDLRIIGLTPTGDTATEEWDLSSGVDSYAMVDEKPPDNDTTYLHTSGSSGEQTMLTLSDFGADGNPIAAMIWGRARKEAATPDKIKLLAGDGTYIKEGDEEDIEVTYGDYAWIVMNQTSGSNAWSDAEADALQIGVEAA